MGISLLRGRSFTAADSKGTVPVAVVNQTLAARVWPGEDALGKRLRVGGVDGTLTVAGVIADVVQQDWIAARDAEIYIPVAQHPETIGRPHTSSMMLVVRTKSDTDVLLQALPSVIASINPSVPATDVQTLESVVSDATRRPRVFTAILAVFAAAALLLASIGIYGLVSYDAGRRTQEIGVRMALGAQTSDVAALVARGALSTVAVGGVVGLLLALAVSRWLATLLYGIGPADAVALSGAIVIVACVSLAASCFPAWRAARMDPLQALRTN
jgi:putative ABC transport system permease protein